MNQKGNRFGVISSFFSSLPVLGIKPTVLCIPSTQSYTPAPGKNLTKKIRLNGDGEWVSTFDHESTKILEKNIGRAKRVSQ